jgi:hypothetical protein
MISLPKLYDLKNSVGANLSVMPVSRKSEYLEIQREEYSVCKAAMEGISPGYKMSFHFQTSGKLGQYECNIQFTVVGQ